MAPRVWPLLSLGLGGIVLLLASGYAAIILYLGGFAELPLHIHIMQGIGIIMMLLFLHLYFAPWRRFRMAVDASEFALATGTLNQIRMIVAINLVLGLVTVVVGASGPSGSWRARRAEYVGAATFIQSDTKFPRADTFRHVAQ
ncbi:MAG: hypothetical protein R3D01_13535 [Hyphomicrobiales bacterium]